MSNNSPDKLLNKSKSANSIYDELKRIQAKYISKEGNAYSKKYAGRTLASFIKRKEMIEQVALKYSQENHGFPKDFMERKEKENNKEIPQLIDVNNEFYSTKLLARLNQATKEKQRRQKRIEEEEKLKNRIYLTKEDCLKSLKLKTKISKSTKDFIKFVMDKKKKLPPSSKYSPNYDSIERHIPIAIIYPLKKPIENKYKQKQMRTEELPTIKHFYDEVHVMAFNKYSSRDTSPLKSNGRLNSEISPPKIKLKKNNSAVDFGKMSSRERKPKHQLQFISPMDYSPNYDYFEVIRIYDIILCK
ncbi:MAG: hypothetical protein MJ252_13095, partial [archaeon]|nr:hypothetical protein [archaeon]